MTELGVPHLSIGDEIPNYVCETTVGQITLHDWIVGSQGLKVGEERYTLILTFPPVPDPVTASDLAWLGSKKARDDIAFRRMNVLGIVCCTMFEFKGFLQNVPELIEDETWDLTGVPFMADEDGELHRCLGQVRPGKDDAVRGRVEASITLLVNPEKEVSLVSTYPFGCGRNFPEIIRAFDSMRITHHFADLATWANWQPGGQEGALIQPRFLEDGRILSNEECEEKFPKGYFECLHAWFRITPIPDLPFDGLPSNNQDEGDEDKFGGMDVAGILSRPGTANGLLT